MDIRVPESPYSIKNLLLCDILENVLQNMDVKIDRAIIPIRDLFFAADKIRFEKVSRRLIKLGLINTPETTKW